MYSLIYISNELQRFDQESLTDLAASASARNRRDAISGYLSYQQHRFLQFLEGPEVMVRALMTNIEADKRHKIVKALELGSFEHRVFLEWGMRYVDDHELREIRMQDLFEKVLCSVRPDVFDEQNTRQMVTRLVLTVAREIKRTDTRAVNGLYG